MTMTTDVFVSAIARTRMPRNGPAARAAALVLESGLTAVDAAALVGLSRQAVSAAVQRIRRAAGTETHCRKCGQALPAS